MSRSRNTHTSPLSPVQKETYKAVVNFMIENLRPPSYTELAEICGVTRKCVYDRVSAMKQKGYILEGEYIVPWGIKVIKNI